MLLGLAGVIQAECRSPYAGEECLGRVYTLVKAERRVSHSTFQFRSVQNCVFHSQLC